MTPDRGCAGRRGLSQRSPHVESALSYRAASADIDDHIQLAAHLAREHRARLPGVDMSARAESEEAACSDNAGLKDRLTTFSAVLCCGLGSLLPTVPRNPQNTVTCTLRISRSPIAALFAMLHESQIDLIVSGAFGHSRTFENLFGGTPNNLLRQSSMPVLLSH